MGWLRRLFGEGKVRAELTFSDGRTAIVKIPYEGDISTLDKGELFDTIKSRVFVEKGLMVTDMKILGITQY